jgi:hypothetical protein
MRVEVRVLGDRAGSLESRTIPDLPRGAAGPGPAVDGATVDPVPDTVRRTTVPLRELLEHVVRAEVTAFDDRERQRRFVRVLTDDQLATEAATGRIALGGRTRSAPVDADQAVTNAMQAFADGLYLAVVDGEQVASLDDDVPVGSDTLVRFVRLTALAGG